MARKRKLNWGPVLWLLTTVNTLAGLLYSPITSVARIRVEGAVPTDRDRIIQAVQFFQGKPALAGDKSKALEELYRRPDVRTVEWSQNLFRRGLLIIRYDRPVARLEGQNKTVLTSRGQICQTAEPVEELPPLELFAAAKEPIASLVSTYESVKIADVCSRASSLSIENLSITVLANGAVCLNSGKTGRVMLGSPDELDEKFSALQEILAKQPQILSQNKEISLVAPSRAMTRPLTGL